MKQKYRLVRGAPRNFELESKFLEVKQHNLPGSMLLLQEVP